ncbi:sodium:calcium antiporter [Bacteriovorax sp. DB6_IX]|uniref:sodium:calcium antiporter n=1 Tax=Bacteriovorax sp. DB6_IX TaxID=1353530 RepID=UPI0004227D08|nr:hypothetical protein [Bacteriovorax sp. DB6_IX]
MVLQVVLLALAIIMLYYGAEFALESAEKIGLALGLSPLVIGLLIVGFGTSLPEFFVSQLACLRGESPIALGNIVGSNIANLFLILGVSGVMVKLHVSRPEIKIQFILHLVLTGLLVFVLFQDRIYPWAAALFGSFFVFYLYDTFKQMLKQRHTGHMEMLMKQIRFIGKNMSCFSLVLFFFILEESFWLRVVLLLRPLLVLIALSSQQSL